MLNTFDLTAALSAVDNTNGSQTILCFIFPAVAVLALLWMASKTSTILALLTGAALSFFAYSVGTSWFMSQPVMLLVAADAVLVAITFFIPERAPRARFV